MQSRRGAAILVLGAALLASAAPVEAGKAVSIDVGSIAIREQLLPGGVYHLPTFGVRNPGTETTSYEIAVSYVDGQQALRPATEWFSFDPATLTLGIGESRAVATTLRIPPGAEAGDYAALVGPRIVAEGSGPQVGAGAAARLTFIVQPSSALDGWLRELFRFLSEHPWVLVVALVAVLAVILWLLRRRYSFKVVRR